MTTESMPTTSTEANWFPSAGSQPALPVEGQIRGRVVRASDVEPKAKGAEQPAEQSAPTLMRVFEVIRQIHDAGGEPTRDRIAEISGLKLTTVDDRIKELRREGYITPQKQCYRPIQQHAPARACSVTTLPDGMTKIELGDALMLMVPAEARELGLALQGKALEATALHAHHSLNKSVVELLAKLSKMEQELARTHAALAAARRKTPQLSMPGPL